MSGGFGLETHIRLNLDCSNNDQILTFESKHVRVGVPGSAARNLILQFRTDEQIKRLCL